MALLKEKSIIDGKEEIEDTISVTLIDYHLVYWFSIHHCYMFGLSTSIIIKVTHRFTKIVKIELLDE
jgi:hypothetical protein